MMPVTSARTSALRLGRTLNSPVAFSSMGTRKRTARRPARRATIVAGRLIGARRLFSRLNGIGG